MTTFIGREQALRDVRGLLGAARLVTVTGPGGMGKTRLATEVARRSARAFADGVAVVELAALDDESEVAPAVAAALGVKDQSTRAPVEQIIRHLEGRRVLLMVDNCEHVVDAVAHLLTMVLERAEGVTVLATSREPLGLPGERISPLGPLALPPDEQRDDAAAVRGSEAVRLLVDRARAFSPQFEVTGANRAAVVQLCERLDGMPLAIELASVRLRSLSVEQVLDRLDERFNLLTSGNRADLPRHRTLRNLVDWSHELCSHEESVVWARMSVFPGTFDIEAAEAVCGDELVRPEAVLDIVDRLLAKSIVIAEPHGREMRYRMLVTIRAYGLGLLEEREEWAATKRRHRDHYLGRALDMVVEWCGPRQHEWLTAMQRDHPNLVAALEWSVATSGEEQYAQQLASLLRYHWVAGGNLSDGRRWCDRILALDGQPTRERGDALWATAWVCLIQGDRQAARGHLDACREIAEALGDDMLRAHTDHWTGLLQLFSGETASAIASYEAAVPMFEQAGDDAAALTALFQLAMAQMYDGELEAALQTCDRVLELSGAHGEQWSRAYALWVTALCQRRRDEPAASLAAAREALELQRGFQDGICIALTVDLLSWLAADSGLAERAAELAGAAASVWRQLGTTIVAFGPHISRDGQEAAREIDDLLGPADAERIRSAQLGLSGVEVLELALGGERAPQRQRPDAGPLTPRELEVAQLVAEGLSNRAIAERLVISPRTVDGHVERALAKLAFTSRSQIAAWATVHAATGPST